MNKTKETPDYIHGRFTIGTTSTDGLEYEEFKDWWGCEHSDEPVPSENSDAFHAWCRDEADTNWDADLENIKFEKRYNVPCVLSGTLGLWDGKHTICLEKFDSVRDAIDKVIHNGSDSTYCDFDIFFDDGKIEMQHHHHDGTNIFEIHALSRKGIDKCRRAEDRWEDIPELKPHDLKRLPYLYF